MDPVTKLPVISRSLDVHDEPPPDAGTQTMRQLAAFEKEARQRALGLHNNSRTKTKTHASHAAVSGGGGSGGGTGASGTAAAAAAGNGGPETVFPEADNLPGSIKH